MEETENEDVTGDVNYETCMKSSRKELFLDTKGYCFLCLKETSGDSDDDNDHYRSSEQEVMTEVSLRNICRYLNINPCSILLKSLKGDVLNEEEKEEAAFQRNKCDFTVTLCGTCSSLSRKLIDLIREEEMTKLLMKYNLEQFSRILIEAEKEKNPVPGTSNSCDGHWKKFQEKMSVCATPVEVSLVENLRQEAKEKASRKHKQLTSTSLPKIKLEDVNPSKSPPSKLMPTSSKSSEVALSTPPSKEPYRPDTVNVHGTKSVQIPPSPTSCNTPIEWITELFANHCKKIIRNRYQCPFCSRIDPEQPMRQHLIAAHLDRFFAQKNFAQVSEDVTFKDSCNHILLTEIIRASPTIRPIDSGSLLTCSHCKIQFSNEKGFKHHLIIEHYDILEKKLRLLWGGAHTINFGFRKSPPVPVTAKNQIPEKAIMPMPLEDPSSVSPTEKDIPEQMDTTTPNIWITTMLAYHCQKLPDNHCQCPFCKKAVSASNIRFHLLYVHNERYFEKKIQTSLPEITFKHCCRQFLCSETKKAIADGNKMGKGAFFCTLCDRKFSNDVGFKYHFLQKHFRILEEKLANLQTENGGVVTVPLTSPTENEMMSASSSASVTPNQVKRGRGRPRKEKRVELQKESEDNFQEKCYQAVKPKLTGLDQDNSREENVNRDLDGDAPPTRNENKNMSASPSVLSNPIKRGRGRPRKQKLVERQEWLTLEKNIQGNCFQARKRKRKLDGRENKDNDLGGNGMLPTTEKKNETNSASSSVLPNPVMRGRGRPRKESYFHLLPKPNHEFLSEVFTKNTKKQKNHKSWITGYTCLVCQTFPKPYPRTTIEYHLINVHPEVYFIHKKPVLMSYEKFKNCCKVLLRDKSNYKQISSNTTGSAKKFSGILCSFCDFPCRGNHLLRNHCMLNHHDILEEKLVELPEYHTKASDEIQSNEMENAENTEEFELIRERKLNRKKDSPKDPSDWVPPGRRIKIGPRCIKTTRRLTLTQKAEQVQDVVEMFKIRNVSKVAPTTKENTHSVPPPPPKTPEKPNTVLPKRRPTYFRTTTFDCKEKQMIWDTCTNNLKRFDDRFECRVCYKQFPLGSTHSTRVRAHILNVHPEKFFLSEELALSEDQLKSNYKRIVVAEAKVAQTPTSSKSLSAKPSYSCKFCSRKISNYIFFKYHLVLEHYKIIEEKLRKSGLGEECQKGNLHSQQCQQPHQKLLEDILQPSNDIEYDWQQNQSTQDGGTQEVTEAEDATQNSSYECEESMVDHSEISAMVIDKVTPLELTIPISFVSSRLSKPRPKYSRINIFDSKEKQMVWDICTEYFKKKGNQYECGVCSKDFPNQQTSRLRAHIVNAHPEKFFSTEKLNVPEDQIKINYAWILSAETRMAKIRMASSDSSTSKQSHLCEFCGKKLSHYVFFKYHLVLEHYKIIEEKMKKAGQEYRIRKQYDRPRQNYPYQKGLNGITQPSNENDFQQNPQSQDGEEAGTETVVEGEGTNMEGQDTTQNGFYEYEESMVDPYKMAQDQSSMVTDEVKPLELELGTEGEYIDEGQVELMEFKMEDENIQDDFNPECDYNLMTSGGDESTMETDEGTFEKSEESDCNLVITTVISQAPN